MGSWLYPNGTVIPGNSASSIGANVTRSSHTHQIRLNRKRTDALPPTGMYTCEVPDVRDNIVHAASIILG